MKDLYAGGRNITVVIVAALCLVTATAGPVFAQRGGSIPTPPVDRRLEQLNRQADEYDRDELSRGLKEAGKPGDRSLAPALAAQIRHDFEGLQAGYNQIVLAMAAKGAFNLDSVLGAVAEIKKCSTRLKGNLALPRPSGPKEDRREASAQMEASLLTLRKHIYNFVTNPLFSAPAALDIEEATKAGRDLDKILELSGSIGKNVRLNRH